MSHSVLYKFLVACIPVPELFGVPRIYGMLDSLLSVEESRVQKLEKLTVQNLVKMAIADPRKAEELRRVLNRNQALSFSPLLFGDCPEISEFIVNSTPIEPIVGFQAGSRVLVCVETDSTMIAFSENRFFDKKHSSTEAPVKKIIELLFVIFQRPPEVVTFMISIDVPNATSIVERILQLKNDQRCRFKNAEATISDDCHHVYFFNE